MTAEPAAEDAPMAAEEAAQDAGSAGAGLTDAGDVGTDAGEKESAAASTVPKQGVVGGKSTVPLKKRSVGWVDDSKLVQTRWFLKVALFQQKVSCLTTELVVTTEKHVNHKRVRSTRIQPPANSLSMAPTPFHGQEEPPHLAQRDAVHESSQAAHQEGMFGVAARREHLLEAQHIKQQRSQVECLGGSCCAACGLLHQCFFFFITIIMHQD